MAVTKEYIEWVNFQFDDDVYWEGAMCAVEAVVTANLIKRNGNNDDPVLKCIKVEGQSNLRLSLENLTIGGDADKKRKNADDEKCVKKPRLERVTKKRQNEEEKKAAKKMKIQK